MKKTSGILLILCLYAFCYVSLVCAGAYDIKELTPVVKEALDGRKARNDQMQSLKDKGIVGENNKGYVQLLVEGQGGKGLVNAENHDRKVIYEAIVEQNNLDAEAIKAVEKVFAQERRDRAKPGEKIQEEAGNWITK